MRKEEEENRIAWEKLSPESKGKQVARFKLWYGMKYGERVKSDPPKKILDALIKKQIAYYKKHPLYKDKTVPNSIFESVIPKKQQPKPKKMIESMDDVIGSKDGTPTPAKDAPVRTKIDPPIKKGADESLEMTISHLPNEKELPDDEVAKKAEEVVL